MSFALRARHEQDFGDKKASPVMTPETPSEPLLPSGPALETPAAEVATLSVPPPAHPNIERVLPRLKKALIIAEPLSVAIVFVFLLAQSWMRWPDPLIDFPRDLYIAWRVSVGDTLYEKVASWYGPLAHLVEAAGFRLFGVGMDTIVWMNVGLSLGIVLLLRGILGAVGNRFSVWLGSIIFLLMFLVCHLVDIGNYNFITPYVAQTTYGFAGLLLVLWALLWHLRSDWGWWLFLAGAGVGVAYLDKPEPLLAAVGALGLYGAVRLVQRYQQHSGGRWRASFYLAWTSAVWLAVGFMATWVPVFLYFLFKGGVIYALKATDWVIYTMVAESFRKTVTNSQIFSTFFGFDQPLQHFLAHLQAAVLLLLVCGIMVAASRAWARAKKFSQIWWLGLMITVAAGAGGAWLGEMANMWTEIGTAFNFSTILLTAVLVGWCVWAAWKNHHDYERILGLAVLGTAASLMLARMILFGRVYHYGFFMAPLAVLFVIHLVVVEGARDNQGQRRTNWLLPLVFSIVALYAGGSLTWFSMQRYAQKTFEVGTGRDRFYTFQPFQPGMKLEEGVMYSPNGMYLKLMLEEAAKDLPKAKTIVAFPETAAVNYHLRVPSPVAEVEFHPTGLGFVGSDHILDELKANPPDGVFFFMRPLVEYGVPHFGWDEGSGQVILNWVAAHYTLIWNAYPHSQYYYPNVPIENNIPLTPTGDAIDLLIPSVKSDLPSAEELMKTLRAP